MKIKIGKIAEIHIFCNDSFYVGKIISFDKDFVFINRISNRGEYDGYFVLSRKIIYKIVYSTKYVDFFFKVLDDQKCLYIPKNLKDLVDHCYKNHKCIQISKYDWDEKDCENVVILENKNEYFLGILLDKYGVSKRIKRINYKDLSYLLFDSIKLNSYELFLNNNPVGTND